MIMSRMEQGGVANELLDTGKHEQHNIDLLSKYIKPDSIVIDGGANAGYFSLGLAKYAARVHSFEPQRHLFYSLCGNIVLNNQFNIVAHHAALSDKEGKIIAPVLDPKIPQAYGSYSLISPSPQGERIEVPTVTIDSLDLPVSVIKLDIEGMEPEALRGAKRTIQQHRPVIFAETFICGVDAIMAELPGYTEERLDRQNSIFHV